MSEEEAQTKVELTALLRRFLDEDVAAGEALLEMSARCNPALHLVQTLLFEVLGLALASGKTAELACGIVANLVLWEEYIDAAMQALDLPNTLLEVCFGIDDPYTLSEAVRALTNMAYRGRGHILQPSFGSLSAFVLMVVENSLCGKLLAQAIQLVYYLQVYGDTASQEQWYLQWDAALFFRHLLVASGESTESVNLEISELLKCEKLGDSSGLEWMLLCLDHAASRSGESHLAWSCNPEIIQAVLNYTLTLLLSPSSKAWDDDVGGRAPGMSLSLHLSEKFLLLSILETVCANISLETGKSKMVDMVDNTARSVQKRISTRQGVVYGLHYLLPMLLESCEEVVLMKDAYAFSAVCYLVWCLFAAHEQEEEEAAARRDDTLSAEGAEPPPQQTVARAVHTSSSSRIAIGASDAYTHISGVVEIMSVPENTAWVKSHSSEDGNVVRMLNVLRTALKDASETTGGRESTGKNNATRKTAGALDALITALQ